MNKFESGRNLALLLFLLALSTIIDGLDSTIVSVALPTISQDFNTSIGDCSWVTLTYVIALAAFLLPMAKLAKNGMVKRMFIAGIAIFTISSALCGVSGSFIELTTFRTLQGFGAALMTAAVPAMIVGFLPADKKGLGMGVLAVASGVAVVLGPSIGGFITSYLEWHWIFLINIPFGILSIVLAFRILPRDEGYCREKNPDFATAAMTVLAIGSGMSFLQNIVGDDMPMSALIFCGIASLVLFVLIGIHGHRHPGHTMVSPTLLKRHDFQLLTIAFTMTCMVIMGAQYVLPYHLQITGEYTVSESGLLLSIASLFAIILSVPVGRWCDKRGCKVPSVLAGIGRLVFCAIFLVVSPKDDLGFLMLGLAVMGCSMAFAGTGLATALIHHSDDHDQGDAATFLLEVNYVAAALGVVVFSLILEHWAGDIDAATVSKEALQDSFEIAMLVGMAFSVVAIVCATVVKNIVPQHEKS